LKGGPTDYGNSDRSFSEGLSSEALFRGSWSDVRCTSRERSGPFLFLAYVNDIWRNIELKIRHFAEDCVMYRKILNIKNVEKLQTDLNRLGDGAERKEMKINPNKSNSLSFMRARMKVPPNYSLGDQKFPEASCYKYLGIIIRNDLSWTDQVI